MNINWAEYYIESKLYVHCNFQNISLEEFQSKYLEFEIVFLPVLLAVYRHKITPLLRLGWLVVN